MYREQHFSPGLPQTGLKLIEFYLLSVGIKGTFIFLSKALSLSLTRVYSCVTDATSHPASAVPRFFMLPCGTYSSRLGMQFNSGANPSVCEARSLIPTKNQTKTSHGPLRPCFLSLQFLKRSTCIGL